ncbi:hypothetical protein Sbs19_41730 [Sphingobium sp. BS19]|nr:hypothetical protein Sbs19_41730 [Sphingobium sp. BS19]
MGTNMDISAKGYRLSGRQDRECIYSDKISKRYLATIDQDNARMNENADAKSPEAERFQCFLW